MKKVMRALAMCAALAIMLPGCLKEKREATLNADGSGRVVYEAHLPLMDMSGGGTGKEDTARQARKEAAKILENSDGVDAWKDVSFEVDKDGLLAFKGTAYFRDLNKLSLHGSTNTNMRLAWRAEGDGAQLELVTRDDKKPHAEPAKLSDAEIAQRATDAKNKFKQQLPMFAAMLAEYRSEWSVALPGAPEKTVNFEKVASAPNTVRIVYDGPKMLEALNKLPGDEAFWKEQAASGADFAKDGPQGNALNEKLFGTRGPIQTFVRAPLKNQFDYAAEMAAAKAGFAAMKARLKLDETSALPPPAAGGAIMHLRVVGVLLATETDNDKGIRPFQHEKGYGVSLAGELPGSVLSVKEGELKTAVADNGDNLLHAKEWDRRIHFPHLAEDHVTVCFDVATELPDPAVKGIRELSGTLTYVVAAGTKDVDLGTVPLKADAKGKELDSTIKSVGKSDWQEGSSELVLTLNATSDAIKGVRFLDAQGGEIEAKPQGTMSMNQTCELTFIHKGEFPAQAHILAQMYDNLREYVTPFKIENMDLLGRPAGGAKP